MRLFVGLTRWTDYLGMQVALAYIEERSIEKVVERAEALAVIRAWGGTKEDRVTIAKAERTNDGDVVEWADKLQLAYAERKLLESMFQACERDAALVSRELTRRTGRHDSNSRRADRWEGRSN